MEHSKKMPIEESIKMEPDDDEDLLNQVTFSETLNIKYEDLDIDVKSEEETDIVKEEFSEVMDTDIGRRKCDCIIEKLLKSKVSSMTYSEKETLIKIGRPTPTLDISSKTKFCTRKYNVGQYDKTSWLAGCAKLQKLFCWPCLLFSNDIGNWNYNGFDDLNNMHKAIKRHEGSTSHIVSSLNLAKFGKSLRMDFLLCQHKPNIQIHNQKVEKNRAILKRLIDVVCYLGEQELAFRAHDETFDSVNRGNYIELINLIKNYDPLLESHFEQSSVFSELSNRIQNDLIQCVGEVLLNRIKTEINDSSFVALILDEVTDINTTAVLSKTVRYVNKSGTICERFLGFTDVSADRTASGISKIVFNLIEELAIGPKFVAQTYDGASVMSSELNGLQKKVREKYPAAMFIHCMAHRLNLVLSQSLAQIDDCNRFFAKLKAFSLFFAKSTKRVDILGKQVKKRFPKVAPTCWNYNSCLVETVSKHKEGLIDLFQNIVDNFNSWDTETYTLAQALLLHLQDFEFNFLLHIFSDIFSYTSVLFGILQSKIFDITFCVNKINELTTTLLQKRENFDEFWCMVDGVYPLPAKRRCSIDIKTSHRTLFFEILDSLCNAIEVRFKNLKDIKFLELLDTRKQHENNRNFTETTIKSLQDNYGTFFDIDRLKNELSVLYNDHDLKGKPTHQLICYLKNAQLTEALQQLTKLCELILTLPATSATVERSFSTLKRIHTYARNSQGKERLSSLALISIEKKLLKNIKTEDFYQEVIELFSKQERRIELTFK